MPIIDFLLHPAPVALAVAILFVPRKLKLAITISIGSRK